MVSSGWEKNVEDGEGVRAMEVNVPAVDETNSASCKERVLLKHMASINTAIPYINCLKIVFMQIFTLDIKFIKSVEQNSFTTIFKIIWWRQKSVENSFLKISFHFF